MLTLDNENENKKVHEWISQYTEAGKLDIAQADGTLKKSMGKEAKDVLDKLRKGDKGALARVKQNVKVDEKYQLDNFDLIAWFIIS